jgi:hypothetical protein
MVRSPLITSTLIGPSYFMALADTILNRPELRFIDLFFPWIVLVGVFGFLTAWLVIAILEWSDLSRYVWHLPLAFLALVVLFSSLIGMVLLP